MFENPRRGRQAKNFTTNVPKILHFKSSSEQVFSENCRWVPLDKQLKKTSCRSRLSENLSVFELISGTYAVASSALKRK